MPPTPSLLIVVIIILWALFVVAEAVRQVDEEVVRALDPVHFGDGRNVSLGSVGLLCKGDEHLLVMIHGGRVLHELRDQ